MKFYSQPIAVAVTLIGSLIMPLCLCAATTAAPVYSETQKSAALTLVSQALKSAGAPGIQKATPKQLSVAVASVVANRKNKASFVGPLATALVEARPELTIPIAKMLLADVTRPGDCPYPEYANAITRAVVAANPSAAPEIVRALIEEYPCRAAVFTVATLETAPRSSSKAIASAAFGAAPAGAQIAVRDAVNQVGIDGLLPINPALVNSPASPGSSNNSAATINPANINGGGGAAGGGTNSQENQTGG